MQTALDHSDFSSATWRKLASLLAERLQTLRELNDSHANDVAKTAALRGQIAEVKQTLALAEQASASEDEPHSQLLSSIGGNASY